MDTSQDRKAKDLAFAHAPAALRAPCKTRQARAVCSRLREPIVSARRVNRAHLIEKLLALSGDENSGDTVTSVVLSWAHGVVVNLNLCPFAEHELDSGTVRVVNARTATTENNARLVFHRECLHLLDADRSELSTTLIALPLCAAVTGDFLAFTEMVHDLEDMIENDDRFADHIMIAAFHPKHQWADASSEADPINYDKRAPVPIINLLRTAQVDEYIEQGRTSGILERNQRTLERLGNAYLEKIYSELAAQLENARQH
mmetsp:Transcript_11199/g.30132  ORF Transcript_11199/g.30132 Transcript_11199/m.30132 type:complete len:259 (+) Transcript_11199:195-971(+)